jgi:hypothetical protein
MSVPPRLWSQPGAIDAHPRAYMPGLEGPAEKVVAGTLARLIGMGRLLMEEDPDVVALVPHRGMTKTARLLVGLRPEASA